MRLCRIVAGDEDVNIWNNDWLKPSFTYNFDENSIVNAEVLKNVTPVITFREQNIYNEMYYEPIDSEDIGEYEPYEPKDQVDDVDPKEDDDYLP